MSEPGEKLCPQCGHALGIPGPPSVRFRGRQLFEFVHDLSGAVEIVTSLVCPCCHRETRWTTDARVVRADVYEKRALKSRVVLDENGGVERFELGGDFVLVQPDPARRPTFKPGGGK